MDRSLYTNTPSSTEATEAMVAVIYVIIGVMAIIGYIVNALFMGMMFKKAGIPAWKAWVPVYNSWTFLEMGDQKGWLSLLVLLAWVPLLNIIPLIILAVYMAIAAYNIGLNFGKEGWFVVIYVLLPIVWIIWMAVDKSAVWKPISSGGPTGNQPPAAM